MARPLPLGPQTETAGAGDRFADGNRVIRFSTCPNGSLDQPSWRVPIGDTDNRVVPDGLNGRLWSHCLDVHPRRCRCASARTGQMLGIAVVGLGVNAIGLTNRVNDPSGEGR